jgi:hypothetical protein
MSRCKSLIVATALTALGVSGVAASELVRIEPRPYYGAVVTMEQGVRVFRPLPSQSLMVINPGNKTPLSLSFNRTIEHRSADHASGGGANAANDGDRGYRGNNSVGYSGLGAPISQSRRDRAAGYGSGGGGKAYRSNLRRHSHH